MSLADAARELDVSPATLRRWVGRRPRAAARRGAGRAARSPTPASSRGCARAATRWTRSARRRARAGSPTASSRTCSRRARQTYTLEEAAEASGLEPALIERIWSAVGFSAPALGEITEDDLELLRYIAAALQAGFPLVAFLQLVRVYGQALARIADAEVQLFHLYVHEPLIHDGVDHLEMAEEMQGLARDLLPLASPIMDHVHQRFLQHFLDQDVVGHMELEVDSDSDLDLGRLRVAIAFADLAGYTRLTEEAGEDEAVDIVERFVEAVEQHAARRRADHQDDRRRGDDRRLRRGGAARLGRRLPGAAGASARCRASASTRASRSTATATTTAARSTSPRGWARARRAARCSSRAPLVEVGGPAPRVRAHRRGQAQGLLAVDGAVPRAAGRGGR